MKVTGIRVRYYEYTMKRPIGDVNGPLGNDKASSALTFVDTDEGITGVSLAGNGAVRSLEHLIVGLLESVPQGKAAVLSVHPDRARGVLELHSDGVDWRAGLAGGVPHDRHSAFVLGAAAVLAAHGGGMEVGDGTVTGWIPLRS